MHKTLSAGKYQMNVYLWPLKAAINPSSMNGVWGEGM